MEFFVKYVRKMKGSINLNFVLRNAILCFVKDVLVKEKKLRILLIAQNATLLSLSLVHEEKKLNFLVIKNLFILQSERIS